MSVERGAERTCGTVANALCDLRRADSLAQQHLRKRHAPACCVFHRGHANLLSSRTVRLKLLAEQGNGAPPLPFASRMIRVGFCPPYRLASPLSVFCPARSLAQRLARDLPDGCRPKVCQKPWQMDWCRFGGWRHHLSLRDRRRTCSGAPISCSSGSPQTRRIDLQCIAAPHVILMGDRDRPDSEALT